MMDKFIYFLRLMFPFLLTIGLWRLSLPFWNPAGILAIIPIFFCSFVKPVDWFTLFSIFMCLTIDYKFETVCFWVAIYCLFSAINAFQSLIDIKRMDKNGIFAFMIFFGISVLFQTVANFTFINILRGLWIFCWVTTLYIPVTQLIKRVHND